MRRTDFGPNADLNYKELSKLMNKEAHKISGIFSKLDLDVKVDDVHDFCMPVGGTYTAEGSARIYVKATKNSPKHDFGSGYVSLFIFKPMEFIGSTLERLASDNNEYEFVPMPIDGVAELGVSLVTVCDNLKYFGRTSVDALSKNKREILSPYQQLNMSSESLAKMIDTKPFSENVCADPAERMRFMFLKVDGKKSFDACLHNVDSYAIACTSGMVPRYERNFFQVVALLRFPMASKELYNLADIVR